MALPCSFRISSRREQQEKRKDNHFPLIHTFFLDKLNKLEIDLLFHLKSIGKMDAVEKHFYPIQCHQPEVFCISLKTLRKSELALALR